MFAEVIVDIAAAEVDRIFDYETGGLEIKKGVRVLVSFGRMTVEGFVVQLKNETDIPADKLKAIDKVLDAEPLISDEMFALMEHLTARRHMRKVDALRLFIPAAMRGGRVKELTRQYAYIADEFRDDAPSFRPNANAQIDLYYYLLEEKPEGEFVNELTKIFSAAALRALSARGVIEIIDAELKRQPYSDLAQVEAKSVELIPAQAAAVEAITATKNQTFLILGVTGSGKTEVYMRCIDDVLARGKTAIMLVPEIALTAQMLRNFRSRFGDKVSLLHSGLNDGEKFDEWRKAKSCEATVVLGARSAIFAPLENVGIIIIDEEHDSSYISEHVPRYKTIDIAEFRKEYNGCNLILGSATPSIETFFAAKAGDYKLIEMPDRINKKPLPKIEIVNMSEELAHGNNTIFSTALRAELEKCIGQDNQAMLFLNRRGYASYVMCKKCGYVAKCDRCDVSLVYHRDEEALKCHYCGNRYGMLDVCPECGSAFMRQGNIGTQKVVEQLEKMFPTAVVLRMDNDNTRGKDSHAKILGQFGAKKANILVGTQMIAKGHDFPDVTLVGILDSDMSLHFADYRSVEKTYQLTTQVAGRAGRDNKPGTVILQTYSPHHYVYKFVRNGDYYGFYDKEANLRDVTKYPPFSTIVRVLVSGADDGKAGAVLKSIYDGVAALKDAYTDKFIYLGYMRAPIKKVMDEYRMQILVRLERGNGDIVDKIFEITENFKTPKVTSYAEVNPARLS